MSSRVSPALSSAFGMATPGPSPIRVGSTPADAVETTLNSGVAPRAFALSRVVTTNAAPASPSWRRYRPSQSRLPGTQAAACPACPPWYHPVDSHPPPPHSRVPAWSGQAPHRARFPQSSTPSLSPPKPCGWIPPPTHVAPPWTGRRFPPGSQQSDPCPCHIEGRWYRSNRPSRPDPPSWYLPSECPSACRGWCSLTPAHRLRIVRYRRSELTGPPGSKPSSLKGRP